MTLSYHKGSVLEPIGDGPKIIAHVCNNIGKWGSGFVVALSAKWDLPEDTFKENFRRGSRNILGDVQFCPVETDIAVCNMIAMNGVYSPGNPAPLNYEALETALEHVYDTAWESACSVHMPKIGAGLARGDWNKIEAIIVKISSQYGVPTTIYEL